MGYESAWHVVNFFWQAAWEFTRFPIALKTNQPGDYQNHLLCVENANFLFPQPSQPNRGVAPPPDVTAISEV